MIEAVAPAIVKAFAQQLALPKHPGLRRLVRPGERMRRGLRHFSRNEHVLLAFAKHQRVATQPIAFGVLAEITRHRGQGTRQIEIITIEISYDVARGLGQSLVESMRLTAILFAHPKSELAFVFANNFDAAVSAAAIDDDEFQRFILLIKHRVNCLFEVPSLIQRRRDNAKLRLHKAEVAVTVVWTPGPPCHVSVLVLYWP